MNTLPASHTAHQQTRPPLRRRKTATWASGSALAVLLVALLSLPAAADDTWELRDLSPDITSHLDMAGTLRRQSADDLAATIALLRAGDLSQLDALDQVLRELRTLDRISRTLSTPAGYQTEAPWATRSAIQILTGLAAAQPWAGQPHYSSLSRDRFPTHGLPYREGLIQAAERHQITPELLAAVVWVESDFDPFARSPRGAVGLGQLVTPTAESLGLNVGGPIDQRIQPIPNLMASAKYLRYLLGRFDGDETLALAAYNAGPTRVAACGCVPPFSETRNYLRKVEHRRQLLTPPHPDRSQPGVR